MAQNFIGKTKRIMSILFNSSVIVQLDQLLGYIFISYYIYHDGKQESSRLQLIWIIVKNFIIIAYLLSKICTPLKKSYWLVWESGMKGFNSKKYRTTVLCIQKMLERFYVNSG